MNHKELLKMAVRVAESRKFNPHDLEYKWYAPWCIVLMHWFGQELLVCPQHTIVYISEDRDGNDNGREIIPDFVITKYTKFGNNMSEFIPLIVENKRSVPDDELKKGIHDASKQLHDYVDVVFITRGYDEISGIIAVGRYWKWYKYSRLKNKKGKIHKTSNSWGNESYTEGDKLYSFKIKWESPIYDLLSNRYEEQFRELSSYVN